MTLVSASLPLATAAAVLAIMLAETALSRSNERRLRGAGALEPRGDVYRAMAILYPAGFVAMGAEGAVSGPPPAIVWAAGLLVFVAAKALKYWAIASLGRRWTFRVLVVPGAPLVTRGPYAFLRHPNYVGVIGELLGMALMVAAPIAGALSLAAFAWLLRRRIAVEDRALGRQSFTRL